ncbi:MAG: hypothetical protein H7Z74_06690 [Anaerolineae bacterium]|nr:hypothetical protein [Gemmatimonadaceae bacterium]
MRRLVFMLGLVIACDSPTAAENTLLRVSVRDGIVRITNRSDEVVTFILATRTYLELVDPLPCTTPGGCTPTLPPRGSIAIPYSEILGYEAGDRTAVLIHWVEARTASPDDVHRTVLLLR